MKNFDWQTGEVDNQFLSYPDSSAEKKKQKWRRKILALPCFLALITAIIYWQLDRRADAQTAAFEADVLAAFQIWQQAVAQSDVELFNTLLVGADPAWAATQRSFLHDGILIDRSPLDLTLAVEDDHLLVRAVAVSFSPNWSSAEISFEQTYDVIDHPVSALSSLRQIRLAQQLTFRRSSGRWFLAPPGDDYWGKWQTEENSLLTLTYPERDEALALRLAQNLESDFSVACRHLPAGRCSRRGTIELRLENGYNNLALLWGRQMSQKDGRHFTFPSPSLVGRPVDEEGFELLYRVYMNAILNLLTSQVDTSITLPGQSLKLVCYPSDNQNPKLIRSVSSEEWTIEIPRHSFHYLSRVPANEDEILEGRWATTSRSSPNLIDAWTINVHDTELNETHRYVVRFPSATSIHPYYGWSKDGNWLVIVDQKYLRLIAPAQNYEHLIIHRLLECSQITPVDPEP